MKYIVIDNGIIFYRSVFVWRTNRNIPIFYLWLRSIIACLKRIGVNKEDKIILAIDSSKGSWRRDVYPEYKTQRKEQREKQVDIDWQQVYCEFNYNLEELEEIVDWHFIKVDKMEADDIGAVVAKHFENNQVVLISSDSDWEQLTAYDNVKLFSPISKKYKEIKNPYKTLRKKIIGGDVADNIKGSNKENDYLRKVKIISLLELPNEVESKILSRVTDLPKKELFLDRLPFQSIVKDYLKIYEKKKVKIKKKKEK